MNTQHTPGPWSLGDENNYHAEVCIGETEMVAGMCRESSYTGQMTMSREEMLANAHLIIAAPDLLAQHEHNKAICDSLIALFKEAGWQDDCTLINQLKSMRFDAIARAKGEP